MEMGKEDEQGYIWASGEENKKLDDEGTKCHSSMEEVTFHDGVARQRQHNKTPPGKVFAIFILRWDMSGRQLKRNDRFISCRYYFAENNSII